MHARDSDTPALKLANWRTEKAKFFADLGHTGWFFISAMHETINISRSNELNWLKIYTVTN